MTEERTCKSCHHSIDAAAKLCPYCGADPETGAKMDVRPLIEEHFPPRAKVGAVDRVAQTLRARQGIAITAVAILAVAILIGVYQFVSRRNAEQASDAPAVPLTEITDLNRQNPNGDLPIPDLKFEYTGDGKNMLTYVVEPGAVAPPPPTTTAAGGAQAANAAAPTTPLAFRPNTPQQQPAPMTAPSQAPAAQPPARPLPLPPPPQRQ